MERQRNLILREATMQAHSTLSKWLISSVVTDVIRHVLELVVQHSLDKCTQQDGVEAASVEVRGRLDLDGIIEASHSKVGLLQGAGQDRTLSRSDLGQAEEESYLCVGILSDPLLKIGKDQLERRLMTSLNRHHP